MGSRWASTTIVKRECAYNPWVPEPARRPRSTVLDDDPPSLDPSVIEHNYRRERARRRARVERQSAARNSNIRFYVTLFVIVFVTAFAILAAWHELSTLFGI
jgi:hypothetical protein